jgi:hypothetical protein
MIKWAQISNHITARLGTTIVLSGDLLLQAILNHHPEMGGPFTEVVR